MRFEIKTVTILMCAALAFALGSCTKKTITPAEDPQPAEVGFTASSQAVWVKGGETPTTSFPYDNFGVWGIARQEVDGSIYNLWGNNALAEVSKNDDTKLYEPTIAAYWVSGYAYRFIAVAPYNDSGYTFGSITPAATDDAPDKLTFSYDMSGKYSASETYTFDLLGAAADSDGAVASGRTDSQTLTFWHLFAKIIINVNFVNADGTAAGADTYNVSEIRLCNVGSKADYTIYGVGDDLNVSCSTPTETKNLTFSNSATNNVLHLIPQDITDFELYIDFVRDGVAFDDFKAALSFGGKNPSVYNYNEVYNWNITIGPKNAISFQVEVAPWGEVDVNDDAPIEII